jgi:hypothetical protein
LHDPDDSSVPDEQATQYEELVHAMQPVGQLWQEPAESTYSPEAQT